MNNVDSEYHKLTHTVLQHGKRKKNRTGVDTIGVFGAQARFDLQQGFPLLTTKKIHTKSVVHELLWFLSGSTNIEYLVQNGINIWNDNAYANYLKKAKPLFSYWSKEEYIEKIRTVPEVARQWGNLGEGTYGGMWRGFPYSVLENIGDGQSLFKQCTISGGVDQISKVINTLKTNPDDRRMIVSAWHPYWVDHCVLPPCHCLFQFHTEEFTSEERWAIGGKYGAMRGHLDSVLDELGVPKRRLNCQLYQRSCDLFLGVPFNIASYSLLLSMIAQVVNMVPGDFVHTFGDLHIYENHMDQIKIQLGRKPLDLPTLSLNPKVNDIFNFKFEDIIFNDYNPHPAIKAEMAV